MNKLILCEIKGTKIEIEETIQLIDSIVGVEVFGHKKEKKSHDEIKQSRKH
jgi:hypothetical protein